MLKTETALHLAWVVYQIMSELLFQHSPGYGFIPEALRTG